MVVSRIEPLRDELAAFGRETHANFDAVLSHFDRLESEYHALRAAVLTTHRRSRGLTRKRRQAAALQKQWKNLPRNRFRGILGFG